MKMHNCYNKNFVGPNLVYYTIRKSFHSTSPGPITEKCPGFWVLDNSFQSSTNFNCKFESESFPFLIIVFDCIDKFILSRFNKFDNHIDNYLLIFLKTSSAGMDFISPASYASIRSSASFAQSSSIDFLDANSKLDKICSTNSARSIGVSSSASVSTFSVFLVIIISLFFILFSDVIKLTYFKIKIKAFILNAILEILRFNMRVQAPRLLCYSFKGRLCFGRLLASRIVR